MIGVLLSRGPDAVLAKGSTIEMVLDRPLYFEESELSPPSAQPGRFSDGPGPTPRQKSEGTGILFPRRRVP